MKRKLLLLLLAVTLLHLSAFTQIKNPVFQAPAKIANDYFRISPFNKDFSSFVQRLMTDPMLTDKTIHRKTDTTLFFLEGWYKTFRPFFFLPDKVKVILAEKELAKDSMDEINVIYLYQLVAYAPPGEEGAKDVQSEYEKLSKKFKHQFDMSSVRELKTGENKYGEVREFYDDNVFFQLLSLAWNTTEKGENLLAMTLRFLVYENTAVLPVTGLPVPANRF